VVVPFRLQSCVRHCAEATGLHRQAGLGAVERLDLRAQQHHLRPPHVLLRAIPIGHDRCQPRTIRRSHEQAKIPSHPGIIAPVSTRGNLMLQTIH
jgi:hypothetical protein